MRKVSVAILGSGNIGTDLMYKIKRSPILSLAAVCGIDPSSKGLALARAEGFHTSFDGIQGIIDLSKRVDIVFDATTAHAHLVHAPILENLGIIAIDLTPASVGTYIIPPVNLEAKKDEMNYSMVTCGGQAVIPIIYAVSRVASVSYAEVVVTISSRSAGPGTRQNIDEFTSATANAIEVLGGVGIGKALIILNPAEPPIKMSNTIYMKINGLLDEWKIKAAIEAMVSEVQQYVPGYRLRVPAVFRKDQVIVFIEVEGAGDYLPKYSGNLDIMTSAAVTVAERLAQIRVIKEG